MIFMSEVRHNWTKEEILEIYNKPMMELLYDAATIHRKQHDPNVVQVSTLLSIKTGGCSEDCGYCPQAARYHTNVEGNDLMSVNQVKAQALRAKESGSSRVCMGAAWRNVKDGPEFEQVLEMVRGINKLDMEVCCTLRYGYRESSSKTSRSRFICIQSQLRFLRRILQRGNFHTRISR